MESEAVILRPYGIVINGHLELGLELVLEGGLIQEVRPHTGIPELFVVSQAFVNAHSHLEYRSLMGKIDEPEYAGWIREITRLKKDQPFEELVNACLLAAAENFVTGIAVILEHSDRPFAGRAMTKVGLDGVIFQEVITILEQDSVEEKLVKVRESVSTNREYFSGPIYLNPHAYQTVDTSTLRYLAGLNTPLSIHAAETAHENSLTLNGTGPIADFYRSQNITVEPTGKSIIATLDDLGLIREDTQLVHCCDVSVRDIELIHNRKATVAHCPRSNTRLKCPKAPIREMLDANIPVGLGLDSAASSGEINMFAEMAAALTTSLERAEPITPEEVWNMATTVGVDIARRAGVNLPNWNIEAGAKPALIKIHVEHATSTEDLIEHAKPSLVERIEY